MRRNENNLFLIIIGVLTISLIAALYRLNSLTPMGSIRGLYQTERIDGSFYNAQFFGDDEYYIEVDFGQREKLTEGVFEDIGNSNYLLSDVKSRKSILITLKHDGFYYYDDEMDAVLYFKKKAP